MASERVIVLLSASCVSSKQFNSIQNAFKSNDKFECLNSSQLLLNEEQQKSIPMENTTQFCSGAIAAYFLQSNEDINFEAIQKSNKISKDHIFKTTDTFFITKLKQIFFPQKPALEQTLVFCTPPMKEEITNEICEELKLKGIFVLYSENQLSSDQNTNNADNADKEKSSKSVDYSILLCETFGAIDTIQLLIGCANAELCEQFAPNSWYFRYKNENYQFKQISNGIETFIPKLQTERTLALVKPTAVSKGFADNIMNEIEESGFTIIAKKRVNLRVEHAQHFYQEHKDRPFFGELTNFMSSGPIHALILERVGAIVCWRTLLGPTNTFTAQEKAPQSIRAKYGTGQTANAAHGSDSTESAKREIAFYFPEIALTSNEIELRKPKNIVSDYMSQKLNSGETLQEFLVRGLSGLAEAKPGSKLEVVEWFANWCLDNNPNKPHIDEPEEEKDDNSMSFVEKCKAGNGGHDLQIVFILGGPGSGKGTQCKKIVEEYGFIQISAGDLCRKVMNDEMNENSLKVKEIMENGELISTELLLKLLETEIINLKGYKYLLDGFPRSLDQCNLFEKELIECSCALNFNVSDEILTERCLKRAETSGRVDDNKETIQKRLDTFHTQTDPTIEHLKSLNKVYDIDGTKSIEEIWKNVGETMDKVFISNETAEA